MGINTQAKLKKMEDDLKAMKACYNTAGSLVKMHVQKSEQFSATSNFETMRIKFTPKYGFGRSNLINLWPIVKKQSVVVWNPFMQKPQDGSGEVIIEIYNLFPGETVEIIVSGTSPGTFTRL